MNWLWQIAAKKAAKSVVQAVIALLAGPKIAALLQAVGVQVSIDPTLASAATYGALEFVRNWLKNKVGLKGL